MHILQVADFLRGLPPRAWFRLGRAAAYLADDSSDVETMLFEAALDDLVVNVDGDASKDLRELSMQVRQPCCTLIGSYKRCAQHVLIPRLLFAQCHQRPLGKVCGSTRMPIRYMPHQVTLRADVFNHGCMGWEPVVEPWAVAAQLESTLPAQQPSSSSRAGHHELSFTAAEVLEVTASLPAADALASTLDVLSGAASCLFVLVARLSSACCCHHCTPRITPTSNARSFSAKRPLHTGMQQLATGELHLDDALARAPRPGLAQQSPYWVSNETGAAVTFWLAANAQDAAWSAPGATDLATAF